MKCSRTRRGLTLIELAIVMVILIFTGALIYRATEALFESYKTGETRIQVHENLRMAVASPVKEIRQAHKETINDSDLQSRSLIVSSPLLPVPDWIIFFEIPEDRDGNGTVLDATTGEVEYSEPIVYFFGTGLQNWLGGLGGVSIPGLPGTLEGRLYRLQDRNANLTIDRGELRLVAILVEDARFVVDDTTDPENPTVDVTIRTGKDLEEGHVQAELTETVIPRNP